jgi:hypothetical protein
LIPHQARAPENPSAKAIAAARISEAPGFLNPHRISLLAFLFGAQGANLAQDENFGPFFLHEAIES